jgi:serine/threonine protein kinase/formylglycine-generating enzyme required for sulfatase activity
LSDDARAEESPLDGDQTLLRPRPTRTHEANATTEWVDQQPFDVAAGPLRIGYLLGHRYRLERELGAGGMGAVFLASDQEVPGEYFAVKVLKAEIREYPESLALLREEVRKTRSLQHPNIVGVYSLNSDHGEVYVLMEYLEGKTLATLLQEDFGRGMPLDRAWPLIRDVCAALAYAHDHNVIHSDLKPANVFITTAGRAKLLDFGIARAARGRRSAVDPGALGALTPAYASIEMLQGLAPDERDDVYGLGCVIYEMLSGKHPFESRSSLDACEARMVPPPLDSLSRTQNTSLARALAFDRPARTASVEALLAGLKAPTRSRFGVIIGLGALAAVTVAAILAWMMWGRFERLAASSRPDNSLEHARALAERARALGVDHSDRALQEGSRLLSQVEKQVAAGGASEGTPALTEAVTELSVATSSGRRFARLGSGADEVELAMNLCSRKGSPCTAAQFANETPHVAALSPFYLDPIGVTNRDFRAFVTATHHSWNAPPDSAATRGLDAPNYPVRGIDYESAQAYCRWRGKRLPTEDEWEFVARGVEHRLFPWGNDPNGGGADQSGSARRLLPVDQQAATGRFGTRGLGGALWEWVTPKDGTVPVLRGPSWLETDPVRERLAARRLEDPAQGLVDVGFRCAQPVDTWPDAPGFSAK